MKRPAYQCTIEGTSPPLTLYERTDRDNQLYLRWAEGDSHRRPKLLGIQSVRGADGKLDPVKVTRARAMALEQYEAARRGVRLGKGGTRADAEREEPRLSLKAGFTAVLAVPGGKYASRKDPQWGKMCRAGSRVLSVLDPVIPWDDLRARHYQEVWRTLMNRYVAGESDLACRAIEEMVQSFTAASNWLAGVGDRLRVAPQPQKRWRAELAKDWEAITGSPPEVYQPRHSPEEAERLWENLHLADPRFQLWLELGGGELRGGQVLRGKRSHLDLTRGAGQGEGTFRVYGRGNKKAPLCYLTPEQRAAVDYALSDGYLADLEAQYQRGEIKNYPLWPAGKLKKGRATQAKSHADRRTMLGFFYDLEEIAAVDHVEGRGWYGLRRASVDRVRQLTTDEGVKNAVGGWSHGSTVRADIYEDGRNEDLLQETARVRQLARPGPKALGAGADVPERSYMSPAAALRALGVPTEQLEEALVLLGLQVR
jgi:hypothetical protein